MTCIMSYLITCRSAVAEKPHNAPLYLKISLHIKNYRKVINVHFG